MYHLLRADEFGAARALQLGFVQEVVPAGQQIERAQAIAAEICTLAPLAVQEIKRGALVFLEQRRSGRVRRNSGDACRAPRDRRISPKDSRRSAKNARRASRAAEFIFRAPSKPIGALAAV